MTPSLPLAGLPDAGTGHDITRPLPVPSPRLAPFHLISLALASPPGQGNQPASPGWPKDRSGRWLRNAAAGLGVLAAAAAAVSFTAQYRMVDATRHLSAIAALEAAIPDAAALVFASLGIALALHGRRALRARALNLAAVGTSVFMNVLAAAPGWRNLAIWALPPAAYALASQDWTGSLPRAARNCGTHRRRMSNLSTACARALERICWYLAGCASASMKWSASCSLAKNWNRMPFSPSITSRTGPVSDAITRHPQLMASMSDHNRTNG